MSGSNAPYESPDRIQRYGKYFLVRKLAEGGMAEIFLAKQVGAEGFERNVVIKRMLRHLSDEASFVAMFLDEAKLAARLAHQNIVQIHDLGLAEGCYFICMEYLAGEDFSTILRSAGRNREYTPLTVVLRVMADAAQGLHYAHEFADETGRPLNIVHRDISPSNIYVTYSGQVKVLDFGIARAESRSTKTSAGVVKGKYMYMSPEQARGSADHPVDRRADVFSLGVSLYEALTHRRPFARDTDLAILNAVLHNDFVPPRQARPDLPPELEAIVLKAMAPAPEQRYQTAAEFGADIERFLAAKTSGTGGSHISVYLRGLFGEERITQKTRVPTLETLIQNGQVVAGFTNPELKTVAVGAQPAAPVEPPTRAVGPPSGVSGPPKSRSSVPLIAAMAVLLAAAVGLGAYFALKPAAPAESNVAGVGFASAPGAAAAVPSTEPSRSTGNAVAIPPAPAPTAATPEAGAPGVAAAQAAGTVGAAAGVAAEADGGATEVAAAPEAVAQPTRKGGKVRTASATRTKLTAAEIQKVVNRSRAPIMRCFEQHKGDLPADEGQVMVQFTIVESGKVSAAAVSGPLASAAVGKCLTQKVKALRFPAHVDKELTLGLPFAYRVQR